MPADGAQQVAQNLGKYDSASNFIRDSKIALERLLYPGWTSRR
jgi:hypothetical protein